MNANKLKCVTNTIGTKRWYLNGKRHREDGPAVIYANGDKFWCLNDELHREDGPAVIYANGDKFWYLNGKCHREDGPATICANGDKYWYLNDELVTEAEYKQRTQTQMNIFVALHKALKHSKNGDGEYCA